MQNWIEFDLNKKINELALVQNFSYLKEDKQ